MDTEIILALIAFGSLISNIYLSITNGKLQAKIDLNKDKLSRIQENQMEAIARLWQALNLCLNEFLKLTSRLQEFPDIYKSTIIEKNDIFIFYKLLPSQIEKVNNSTNPSKTLSEIILTNYYVNFIEEFNSFSNALKNSIFYLPSDIRELFLKLEKFFHDNLNIADPRYYINFSEEEMPNARKDFFGLQKKMDTEFSPVLENLKLKIQEKFNIDHLS